MVFIELTCDDLHTLQSFDSCVLVLTAVAAAYTTTLFVAARPDACLHEWTTGVERLPVFPSVSVLHIYALE